MSVPGEGGSLKIAVFEIPRDNRSYWMRVVEWYRPASTMKNIAFNVKEREDSILIVSECDN